MTSSVWDYYRHPAVRARIMEFLGGRTADELSCVYVRTGDDRIRSAPAAYPARDVEQALEWPSELNRSLWDRRSFLGHLDIEHVNFDHPRETFTDPERAFELQRPVVRSLQEALLGCGIAPLHLLSGRGHHLVWGIKQGSPALHRLAALGASERFPRNRGSVYPRESIDPRLCQAYLGLGLVMEMLGHRILGACTGGCQVPVQLTAVEATGPGSHGREIISVDLSEYGDPLQERTIRVPFSLYLKAHRMNRPGEDALPPMVMLPLQGGEEGAVLAGMRDLDQARQLAWRASVKIPDQSAGMEELIRCYERTELAEFHRWFYSRPATAPDPGEWREMVPCVRFPLQVPNDLLLKPAVIQNLVRASLARGFHPRQISGLLRRRFGEDRHGWRPGTHFYDPGIRADFYCRLFAGLVLAGMDPLVDFNCRSYQEKGYCPVRDCNFNLADLRDDLRLLYA
ncbi:MAG: hypothetical protein HY319_21895 [Armatimonadetes bacterium]|nr:hypothetical protein [Armatimonadota bacterium]